MSWNLLGVSGRSFPLDLYVGTENGRAAGWFFFRDPRLPPLFGRGLECAGDEVRLEEKNLTLEFNGRFDRDRDTLALTVSGFGGELPVEVGIDPASIATLVEVVRAGELPGLHSVLVARRGRLVVEEYFHGFDRDLPHDQRSASKTIAAALVGLAIEGGFLPGVEARVLDYFPTYRRLAHWDARKARITVRHLLTMSSGLDADDSKHDSMAAESSYQSQSRPPDWLRVALDAPMIDHPGASSRYGSANPMLLGGVLAAAVGEPVERFAHRKLFGPLGITSYRWFHDPTGVRSSASPRRSSRSTFSRPLPVRRSRAA